MDDASETVVGDYLGRLHAAGSGLAPARRDELVAEVREHIGEALRAQRAAGKHGEVVVRNVLERLGPPEEIVRAEAEGQPYDVAGAPTSGHHPFPSPGNQARPATTYGSAGMWGPVETFAVLMLSVGSVLMPLVGLLVGFGLVWVSARWTRSQKSVATVLGVLPALGLLLTRLTGL